MARFYITTAIVYTNASPHIGFALELVQADAVARYRRMLGDDVRFLTGTDEHGTKIMRAAAEAGMPTQAFVDGLAAEVRALCTALNISNDDFIRTSDRARHWPAAQKIWNDMAEAGDLYKHSYEGFYCVGHEAFIKESELVDGTCPLHKSRPERISEENWFFRLTKYTERIKDELESGRLDIVPASRKQEVINLLNDAEDISFSRPSAQLPWGIPVPGDATQTMYVWADALTNYISALGYGTDEAHMDFWPADVHLIGKDILRFHAMFWPAMLLSAGLDLPRSIYVHGFITVEGQKMSKTLGNVIDPGALLESWPADIVRFFMLRELQSTDDSDFSHDRLRKRYESDLANGLGNLVQRTATLIESKLGGKAVRAPGWEAEEELLQEVHDDTAYHAAFTRFRLHDAAAVILEKVAIANSFINSREPWKQEGAAQAKTLAIAADIICHIAWLLQPFMPVTAGVIAQRFGVTLSAAGDTGAYAVAHGEPLFPRK